jgi:hypothetical protein
MDLGCGSADIMVYIKTKLKCKEICGIDNTNRSLINLKKHRLNILKNDILNVNFEGKAQTYYIWIENPKTEIQIIERLLKYNGKCDIIICYNTKGSCKLNVEIPNENIYFNSDCQFCSYLKCISTKLQILNNFLKNSNLNYQTRYYNYNNGFGCRESGEFTYIIVSIN